MSFIRNGIRLEIAGQDHYIRLLGTAFHTEGGRSRFYEIAAAIKHLQEMRRGTWSPEEVAEAYRIAASDLLFVQYPTYRANLANPWQFEALVVAELAEQALDCAARTRKNLIKDVAASVQAIHPDEHDIKGHGRRVMTIGEDPEWKAFATQACPIEVPKQRAVGVILAGGRSTRMSSTIPKPILPLRGRLLASYVVDTLRMALSNERTSVYIAIGFRSSLVRSALGSQFAYLMFEKTPGLAFRVAACLETLSKGLVQNNCSKIRSHPILLLWQSRQ